MKTEAEIELIKKQIDIQMIEYEAAIIAAVGWHRHWKSNHKRGFRCMEGANDSRAQT